MKKFLLSLAAVAAMGLTANAGVVVFDFLSDNYGLTPYDEDAGNNSPYIETPATITLGDVTVELNGGFDSNNGAWRMWSDGLRPYAKRDASFTVSTTNGEKVVYVTWTVANTSCTFALEGTDTNITGWEGEEDSVTFVCTTPAKAKNYGIKTLTIGYGDYEDGDIPEIPDAPTGVISVADAVAYIMAGGTEEITVKGVVTDDEISYNASYGSLTYWIADENNENAKMEVYGGLSLEGGRFASVNSIAVGAVVEVQGTVQLYNGIPEFGLNSILLSYLGPNGETAPSTEGGEDEGDAPSVDDAMTVAEALAWIAAGNEGNGVVKGIIYAIDEVSTQYGNATYTIKDNLSDPDGLIVYRGYYLDGAKFTAEDQLEVGATVVVSGELVNYNETTPEFTTGSKLLAYYAPGEDAGVEGIEADNSPAVYYNLQGVKVANPEKGGLYIVRQGNKVSKVILK